MTSVPALVPPEQRFGASTLPAALRRAAGSGHGYLLVRPGRPDERLGFAELARRADAVAASLRRRGLRRGDRVGLLLPTSAELLVAIWGVWSAGGVAVVLALPARPSPEHRDDAAYPAELATRVGQVTPHATVVADDVAARLPGTVGGAPVVGFADLEGGGGVRAGDEVGPDDLAVLQFTSGTTARSRAVALTHRQLLSNVSAMSDALDLSSRDRGLSWLPLFHDMGLLIVIVAAAHPGDLVLLPTEEFGRRPGCWMDTASRLRCTVTVAPSTGYSLATKDLGWRPRDLDLSGLRVAGNGAEPVDPAVLAAFVAAAAPYGMSPTAPCPMYGLAEATLAVTSARPGTEVRELWAGRDTLESMQAVRLVDRDGPGARRLVSCGPPVPGTAVEIRNGPDVLPEGHVGEIVVRSPSVMHRYWDDPGGTAAALRDGWLYTGDLGFVVDGELVVCGRLKDMIISGGRNLYPEDYEQLAAARDGVRRGNVVAFGLTGSERMVVVAESRLRPDQARQLAEDLLRDMTRELSHAPEEVLVTRPGALPKTSSGKVQRDRCRQMYRAAALPVVASVRRR